MHNHHMYVPHRCAQAIRALIKLCNALFKLFNAQVAEAQSLVESLIIKLCNALTGVQKPLGQRGRHLRQHT